MRRGFTMIEFLIALALFAGGLTLIFINVLSYKKSSELKSTIELLTTDIRSMQFKAMAGDTEGRTSTDNYGVYFGLTNYTLFNGLVYNPNQATNFVVNLPGGINFVNNFFVNSSLVFSKGSGEVIGWTQQASSIAISDSLDGRIKTISVNRYGVVDDN